MSMTPSEIFYANVTVEEFMNEAGVIDWEGAYKQLANEFDKAIEDADRMRKALQALKHLNNHTIDEEMWRIDAALNPTEDANSVYTK